MADMRTTIASASRSDRAPLGERRGARRSVLLTIVLLFALLVGVWYMATMAPWLHAKGTAGSVVPGRSMAAVVRLF